VSRFVVDASVAVKWFLPEEHSREAGRLLKKGNELLAPDLVWAELGNVVWKRFRRGEIGAADGESLLRDLRRLPLWTCPSDLLLIAAWSIAMQHNCTVHDGLYLALALNKGCPLITADASFYRAPAGGDLSPYLLWIGDIG
jgi:predicted nucleic acid-binding protein